MHANPARAATTGRTADAPRPATILFPLAGGLVGGSHFSALALIDALDRDQFRPCVMLHQGTGALAELLEQRGQPFELVPQALTSLAVTDLLRTLPARVRFLRQRGIAIVHTNEGAMHAAWGPAARFAGARLLWHHRGHPRARGLRYLAPLFADRVVAVSHFAAPPPGLLSAAGKTLVIRSPFDAVPPVLDRAANAAARRTELGVGTDTVLLGFFGHLAARKRPLVFVEAVAELRRHRPSLPVLGVMFGGTLDAGLDDAVRALAARLGVADAIRLMGFRQPIAPWLAACDANVVTAVDEPFGRTLIEAMLLGTPVIAAASGGSIEAIDDGFTGLLVPPDDPQAFAAAVLQCLLPGCGAKLAAAAMREARAAFGVAGHASAVSAVYHQLLAA